MSSVGFIIRYSIQAILLFLMLRLLSSAEFKSEIINSFALAGLFMQLLRPSVAAGMRPYLLSTEGLQRDEVELILIGWLLFSFLATGVFVFAEIGSELLKVILISLFLSIPFHIFEVKSIDLVRNGNYRLLFLGSYFVSFLFIVFYIALIFVDRPWGEQDVFLGYILCNLAPACILLYFLPKKSWNKRIISLDFLLNAFMVLKKNLPMMIQLLLLPIINFLFGAALLQQFSSVNPTLEKSLTLVFHGSLFATGLFSGIFMNYYFPKLKGSKSISTLLEALYVTKFWVLFVLLLSFIAILNLNFYFLLHLLFSIDLTAVRDAEKSFFLFFSFCVRLLLNPLTFAFLKPREIKYVFIYELLFWAIIWMGFNFPEFSILILLGPASVIILISRLWVYHFHLVRRSR